MKRILLCAALCSLFAAGQNYTAKTFDADVSVTGTSSKVLSFDTYRNYLLIQNRGTVSVYFKCDTAHSGTEGIEIIAGGYYEPLRTPSCDIYLKAASGTQNVHIIAGKAP